MIQTQYLRWQWLDIDKVITGHIIGYIVSETYFRSGRVSHSVGCLSRLALQIVAEAQSLV